MKRAQFNTWTMILVSPIVLILIVTGLWLVFASAYENYRLSHAAEEVLMAVSVGRSLKLAGDESPQFAVHAWAERMLSKSAGTIIDATPAFLDKPVQKGYENAWGVPVPVYFSPKERVMRLEIPLTPVACRRLLLIYADEAGELGLLRADIYNENSTNGWVSLFQANRGDKKAKISDQAISAGCLVEGTNVLSLSFSL